MNWYEEDFELFNYSEGLVDLSSERCIIPHDVKTKPQTPTQLSAFTFLWSGSYYTHTVYGVFIVLCMYYKAQ